MPNATASPSPRPAPPPPSTWEPLPGRACRRAGARSLPHRPGDPALRQEQERPRITLSCATFQGRIRVTDPEALRAALLGGVGPSKGYGQGLLTLGPLPPEAPHA
ncbi:type I-E CRISPR-associated protein Cas6/Cse3/CasE [Streptomyces achromogenes]|uniref:type I-E CRISPR-associated protein Cas6/Cse3/CasE n=1 Tax=Streptomyces achromogenes TaxID=67255 RepID=UPI0033D4FC9C